MNVRMFPSADPSEHLEDEFYDDSDFEKLPDLKRKQSFKSWSECNS